MSAEQIHDNLYRQMKKLFLFFSISSFSFLSYANSINENDILGAYTNVGVVLFEDNNFYLGGMGAELRGKWMLDENKLTLTSNKEPLFVLYGRQLREPDQAVQIRFLHDFMKRDVWVNTAPKSEKSAKRLFKERSCRGYQRYSHSQTSPIERLFIAQKEDAFPLEPEHTLYDFEIPEGFNDLIGYMPRPESLNIQTFTFEFKNGELCQYPLDYCSSKEPLEELDEFTLKIMKKFIEQGYFPSVLNYDLSQQFENVFQNELYPKPRHPNQDNTQDFTMITPQISSEVLIQDSGHLVDVECNPSE